MPSKGIVFAGGSGSRLLPMTRAVNKHFLPVYDKPMIYYPLMTLMELGVRQMRLLINPEDQAAYQRLLGDGSQWDVHIHYQAQDTSAGFREHLLACADFIADDAVYLMLGDNFFYGKSLIDVLKKQAHRAQTATIFTYPQKENTESFAVVRFDAQRQPLEIIEKPNTFISDQIVTGLYGYGAGLLFMLKKKKITSVTDLNNYYLQAGKLTMQPLPPDTVWFDLGTPQLLHQAANFVFRGRVTL